MDSIVTGYVGLGDNFYQLPAIAAHARTVDYVYLYTPWPQLFWHVQNVRPVKPSGCAYRTQAANMAGVPETLWFQPPPPGQCMVYGMRYDQTMTSSTPPAVFAEQMRVTPNLQDSVFRPKAAWVEKARGLLNGYEGPLGVVHVPTIRLEWPNTSRIPAPGLLKMLVETHPDIAWVAIGWESYLQEVPVEQPPQNIGLDLSGGQADLETILGMVSLADIALCSPSFLLPMAQSIRTPVFCLFGGQFPPSVLVDPIMGGPAVGLGPKPFCACGSRDHACKRDLSPVTVLEKFSEFLHSTLDKTTRKYMMR